MKTSNKLLIAFATALIIVPILSMVVVSKAYYIDVKSWVEKQKTNESFEGKSENLEAISLSPFNGVNIADGKAAHFYIRLVNDNKFGIKINKGDGDFLKTNVDQNGILQIALTDQIKGNNYVSVIIYTPNIAALAIKNANGLTINARLDSLAIHLKKAGSLSFDSATQFSKLSVSATDGNEINLEREVARSLSLNLTNTNFTSEWASYQDLNLDVSGKSNIVVKGDYRKEKEYTIKNLSVNTNDEANINFEAIKIQNAKGTLSDQTIVLMPAVNLKQILK